MDNNIREVINEVGQSVKIEIIGRFRIAEVDREYIIYTLNDDNISDEVIVLIAQVKIENSKMKLLSIPDKERNMVVAFFNSIKNNICEG